VQCNRERVECNFFALLRIMVVDALARMTGDGRFDHTTSASPSKNDR